MLIRATLARSDLEKGFSFQVVGGEVVLQRKTKSDLNVAAASSLCFYKKCSLTLFLLELSAIILFLNILFYSEPL